MILDFYRYERTHFMLRVKPNTTAFQSALRPQSDRIVQYSHTPRFAGLQDEFSETEIQSIARDPKMGDVAHRYLDELADYQTFSKLVLSLARDAHSNSQAVAIQRFERKEQKDWQMQILKDLASAPDSDVESH